MTACMLDLEQTAKQAGHDLEDAPATEIIRWAADTFGARFAVSSSMQDALLVHLAAQVVPGVDVLFLDTGYHFAETLGTRDAVAATYDINLLNIRPQLSVPEQDARFGARLYDRNPDACCRMRKVEPLNEALQGYTAWATGIRRAETASRVGTPVVSYDTRRHKIKVAPLAQWTDEDVDAYIAEHNIITNPLQSAGYLSIGCAPCTRAVAPGEDPRAGRWANSVKTECGINT